MRAMVRVPAAAVGAVGLTLAPVAAANGDSWQVGVEPRTVGPGDTVTLTSRGCRVPTAEADADVFASTEVDEGRETEATVFDDAGLGSGQEVTFTCDGQTRSVPLTITGSDGRDRAGEPLNSGIPPRGGVPSRKAPDNGHGGASGGEVRSAPGHDTGSAHGTGPDHGTKPGSGEDRGPDTRTGHGTGVSQDGGRDHGGGHGHDAGQSRDSGHGEDTGAPSHRGVNAGVGGSGGPLSTTQLVLGSVLVAGALSTAGCTAFRRVRQTATGRRS